MSWKRMNELPSDDKTYLVCWYDLVEQKFSDPHRAYYLAYCGHFFICESLHAFPLHVDIYMEIPNSPS